MSLSSNPKTKSKAESVLRRSIRILSRSDRRKILIVIGVQIFLGILDLLAVMFVGILGALAVNGIQSRSPGDRVSSVLKYLNLDLLQFQLQVGVLGITAAFLMILRTLLSVYFSRKVLFFLSRRGAQLSAKLVSRLLSQSLLVIQERTTQQMLYGLTNGVATITLGVLGTAVNLIADVSLLIIMSAGLFIVDFTVAMSTFLMFASIGLALYYLMHKRAQALGVADAKLSIASNEKIVEVLESYRESVVRNRRGYYSGEIGQLRFSLADTLARISFLPNISKYVIETSVILGTLVICAIQFIITDAAHAIAVLAVFLTAGTRIAPAVMRVQQGAIQIRGSLGSASPTLDLIENLNASSETFDNGSENFSFDYGTFEPSISIKDVSFKYSSNSQFALQGISLEIKPGQQVAIVGSSGAGKTTLVDLLLGVITPDVGEVKISGVPVLEAISNWSGAISYVPQDIRIANGSIRENVGLGYPREVATDERVIKSLEVAHLMEVVGELENGLDSSTGEKGSKLSGGQRQRLGIARALFTSPKLIVFDEATSALDGETEALIADSIHSLKGSVTVVMIAHRLSTVRESDLVVYMDSGSIQAVGDFETVRKAVPNFDKQAKLMGL
ncbi:ABC transporter ATP-binding protein [Candidatus Planktophila dulcis]|uniref:ABC transporter ATP-binding protein n=1 Tax=Candidatus Planktophila dulcis TaxID=1884914 RepID=UPI003BEEF6F8